MPSPRWATSVVVAVPRARTRSRLSQPSFIAALYEEVLVQPDTLPRPGPADIDPRVDAEGVRPRNLSSPTRRRPCAGAPSSSSTSRTTRRPCNPGYAERPIEELRAMGFGELDSILSDSLPHPVRHRTFLSLADAATVIVERLQGARCRPRVPCSVLAPGVDPAYLEAPKSPIPAFAGNSGSGRREGDRLHGSNTFANEPEMLQLYEAVRILNSGARRPASCAQDSTGRVPREPDRPELKAHVLDLGFIAKSRLPGLLGIADALVQPGRPGPFNDYRLPSKLPEFLGLRTAGRPSTDKRGARMREGVEASSSRAAHRRTSPTAARGYSATPSWRRALASRGRRSRASTLTSRPARQAC